MKHRTRPGCGMRFARSASGAALLAAWMVGTTAQAIGRTWDGGLTGTWHTAANWNPDGVPVAGDIIDINGAAGTVVSLTANPNSGITLVTIYEGNTVTGNYRLGWGGGLINHGIVENGQIYGAGLGATNTGIIQGRGATMNLNLANYTMSNTGGIVRAIDSGRLATSTGKIIGGLLTVESLSTQTLYATSYPLTLEGVAAVNAGVVDIEMTSWAGGLRTLSYDLTSGATFTNTGVLNIRLVVPAPPDNGTKTTKMTVASDARLVNTSSGAINITQAQTDNANNAVLPVYLQISAAGFRNDGAITISTLTNSTGTAQLRLPSTGFTNAGMIVVAGPLSSIEMTNQTMTVLSGATLKGSGTINGHVTMDAGAHYDWSYTNGVGDVMTMNGTVTLPAVATVTVTGGGDIPQPATLFTATTLGGVATLSGWAVEGLPGYKARIEGNSVVLFRSRGTVILVQ